MIRQLLLSWLARRNVSAEFTFPKALRDAKRVLILMPSLNEALRQSEVFLSRVRRVFPKAEITLLYPPRTMVARYYNPFGFKNVVPDKKDVWWWGMPRKKFAETLLAKPFDVLITLNREQSVFFGAMTVQSGAPVRMGLPNGMGDPFVNVELRHGRETADIKTEFILFIDMIRKLASGSPSGGTTDGTESGAQSAARREFPGRANVPQPEA